MNKQDYLHHLTKEIEHLKNTGLYKGEHVITSPQAAVIHLQNGNEVINLCANNYLGLSDHPDLISEAQSALQKYGFGMSSLRFIFLTQSLH